MGTLFKSQSDAGGLASTIEQTERDIVSTCNLKDLLTIYIGDKVIPAFKKEKLELYG
jgi:F0F1-type ATP synthase gamma subunit